VNNADASTIAARDASTIAARDASTIAAREAIIAMVRRGRHDPEEAAEDKAGRERSSEFTLSDTSLRRKRLTPNSTTTRGPLTISYANGDFDQPGPEFAWSLCNHKDTMTRPLFVSATATVAVVNQPVPARLRGQLYIAAAATAWSIAGVMQRGLKIDTPTQASGRAFFAFLALATVCGYEAQRDGQSVLAATRSIGRAGLAMAVCLAAASASFIIALNNASVASVLFIQALAPLVAVVLSQVFLGEHATRRTWIAMGLAVIGVAMMVGGPHLGSGIGLLFAFIMSFLFAVSIVLTRYARHVSLAPGSAISQLLVFVCALSFAHPTSIAGSDLWRLAILGVFQMGLGQLCFVIGARLIAASETALLTLLEVVLGPVWVWLFYRENPGTATLIGGFVVLGAVTYQATESSQKPVAAT
jgi:drug/metabolite transporter (DMT)-like permease